MQEWEIRQLAAIRVLISIAKRLTPEELADCLKQAEAKNLKRQVITQLPKDWTSKQRRGSMFEAVSSILGIVAVAVSFWLGGFYAKR